MNSKKALFIFAHPDDEAIICGGLMAKLASEGTKVHLITATKGEASTAYDRSYCTKDEIPEMRYEELKKAANILGVEELTMLGMMDGTLESLDELESAEIIAREVNRIEPDLIVTFEPLGLSHHPDHRAVHRWVMKSLEDGMFESENLNLFWVTGRKRSGWIRDGIVMGHDDDEITDFVDIQPFYIKKRDAILAHRTQLRALEGHGLIVDGELARNNAEECYIRIEKNVSVRK